MMDDTTNYRDIANELLAIAVKISPTGKEQEAFAQIINESRRDIFSEKEVAVILLSSMLDGLRHGNWPVTIDH